MNLQDAVSGIVKEVDLAHLTLTAVLRLVIVVALGLIAIRVILTILDRILDRSKTLERLHVYIRSAVKVVLILLKIIAGFIVFGLIMAACALIIGMFALIVGGEGFFTPAVFGNTVSIWIASLGILATLIPIILLIYVLMCLIASRKPGGKTVLAIFLLWLASIIAVSCVAIRENVGDKFRTKRRVLEQVFQSEIVIDGDTTTLERLLEDYDDESVIEEGRKTLHISVPSKSIDITVDKKQGELRVNADGRKVSVKASETGDEASVTIRRETDAADSAKTTRGSATRSR